MTPELKAVPMDKLSPLITGLIEDGTDVRFTVTGISMRPLLYNRRDSVLLTFCYPLLLKKRQIPLYKRPDGTYVLHRIVKVGKNSYDMCGDHQWEIERGVDKSSVICVVKGFYRNGVYHSCKELPYRMYSFFWTLALPLRKFAFGLHRKLKRKN